jgi:adenine-specific DNA-methyltransferase
LPLIWATDVAKFGFSFNRQNTSRPCFLKINPKTENLIVKGQNILVQRVTADEQPSRIVACLPDDFYQRASNGYFVENHLNIIQPNTYDTEVNLYFILGVLNSDIVDFFFRAMNGNTQVSATELNLLPIPIGKHEGNIACMAKKIQESSNGCEMKTLISELNRLVANAYGLKLNELEFIQKYINSRFQ